MAKIKLHDEIEEADVMEFYGSMLSQALNAMTECYAETKNEKLGVALQSIADFNVKAAPHDLFRIRTTEDGKVGVLTRLAPKADLEARAKRALK